MSETKEKCPKCGSSCTAETSTAHLQCLSCLHRFRPSPPPEPLVIADHGQAAQEREADRALAEGKPDTETYWPVVDAEGEVMAYATSEERADFILLACNACPDIYEAAAAALTARAEDFRSVGQPTREAYCRDDADFLRSMAKELRT